MGALPPSPMKGVCSHFHAFTATIGSAERDSRDAYSWDKAGHFDPFGTSAGPVRRGFIPLGRIGRRLRR